MPQYMRRWPACLRGSKWRRMTAFIRCDQCGAELEAHLPERHRWQRTWDDARECMAHRCPACAGREVKKGKKR